MNRTRSLAVAMAILIAQPLHIHAQVAAGGIAGKVVGPSGAVVGIAVQVINIDGAVVARTLTSAIGDFSVTGLTVGTFIVQAIGSKGSVLGTSVVTLTPRGMSLSDTVIRLADDAAPAMAARSRIRGAAIVAALAATVGGIVTVIGTKPHASPSR
jgi:hypothetical protein